MTFLVLAEILPWSMLCLGKVLLKSSLASEGGEEASW